jgi:hypothetical protein
MLQINLSLNSLDIVSTIELQLGVYFPGVVEPDLVSVTLAFLPEPQTKCCPISKVDSLTRTSSICRLRIHHTASAISDPCLPQNLLLIIFHSGQMIHS